MAHEHLGLRVKRVYRVHWVIGIGFVELIGFRVLQGL